MWFENVADVIVHFYCCHFFSSALLQGVFPDKRLKGRNFIAGQ
jgi:hypothetical protein